PSLAVGWRGRTAPRCQVALLVLRMRVRLVGRAGRNPDEQRLTPQRWILIEHLARNTGREGNPLSLIGAKRHSSRKTRGSRRGVARSPLAGLPQVRPATARREAVLTGDPMPRPNLPATDPGPRHSEHARGPPCQACPMKIRPLLHPGP